MAPVVIQPPPPRVVLQLGGVLNITCRATGVPTPIIVWRRNWGHVPDKCSSSTSGGYGSLYCENMQHEDSGAYSCEVINTIGTIFVVPDTIVIIEGSNESVCPVGYFNKEALQSDQCISCFCFGVSTTCKSADLFVYHVSRQGNFSFNKSFLKDYISIANSPCDSTKSSSSKYSSLWRH